MLQTEREWQRGALEFQLQIVSNKPDMQQLVIRTLIVLLTRLRGCERLSVPQSKRNGEVGRTQSEKE
jgi:hypothetical protein